MVVGIGRREFIAGLGGSVATWPLAARARQPERLARIGYLSLRLLTKSISLRVSGGVRYLGYVEGKNLHIELAIQTEMRTGSPD